ncbi:hypothetical protein [Amycolatopsis granulosa]|uniref:PIN-like domain-containing protein n=1 Tax=Amycolatopsis granulosa TaxID=185684 RepID=UPI00141D96F7
MTVELERIRFVVDENLLRLGRALVQLREDVGCFGLKPLDEAFPVGRLDPEWIPAVGIRGWVVITDDKHLRTRPGEAELAIKHHLKVVHLDGVGHRTRWEQLLRLTSHWEAVELAAVSEPEGPWWLALRKSQAVKLPYQPGSPI